MIFFIKCCNSSGPAERESRAEGSDALRQRVLTCISCYIFRGRHSASMFQAQRKNTFTYNWNIMKSPLICYVWSFPGNPLSGAKSSVFRLWAMRIDNGYMESIKYWSQAQWFFSDIICDNMSVGRYEKRFSKVLSGSGWLGGIGGGGGQLLSWLMISDQRLHPAATPHTAPLPSHLSPPSDWLNWIKMTPIIGSSWSRCADPMIHI